MNNWPIADDEWAHCGVPSELMQCSLSTVYLKKMLLKLKVKTSEKIAIQI